MADFFSPQTGQKISRFGAALGGRLPQFDIAQEQRQQRTQNESRRLSAERRKALLVDNRQVRRFLESGDVNSAISLLNNRVENIDTLGGDPKDTLGLLRQLETDPKGALVEVVSLDNRAVDEGMLNAFPKSEAPKPISAKSVVDGQVVVPTAEGGFRAVKVLGFNPKTGEEESVVVKASDILSDGTVIQSTSKGVRIFDATGKQITGQDAVDAVKQGRAEGVKVAGDTAAAKAAADSVKQSIKISGDAFKAIGPIRSSLRTMAKARQALAEGAQTGAIDKFLPSIRESSIKLDNLMNQLGLEVISGTTFGALSEGELRLALDTALPTGLQPDALDRWLADKQASQLKLLNELEDDIDVLSNGGTLADITAKRRRQRREGEANPKGQPAPGQPVPTTQPAPKVVTPAQRAAKIRKLRGG